MIAARRIAIVLPGFELSGAEHQALMLAHGLVRDHGRAVLVAACGDGRGAVAQRCAELGLPILCLTHAGGRWPWLARWRAHRSLSALRDFQPDVLVPFTVWPNVACSLGRRASGARAVLWNQRDEGLFSSYPHAGQVRQAVLAADRLVANSSAGVTWLVGQGAVAGRIEIVANGCGLRPPFPIRADVRRELGLPDRAPVAVMVAHESERKDHMTLIQAWAIALPALPSGARLLLAGNGGFAAVRSWIAARGLQDTIQLLGPRSDVPMILAASDLVVHAAHGEGLPNAVIEAMMMERAVIGSDVPGVRDALGPHAARRLVQPCNPEALAAAIVAALTTHMKDDALATAARWASNTYAPERMVSRFAELIDQAVGG